ncbi:MAG: DUF2628 domain-containing protein [Rickettsiales bacterium]
MALFNRVKIYSVHVDPAASKPMENAVFIPEGFNFFAFLFSVFWALYHRLWIVAGVYVLLAGGATLIAKTYGMHPSSVMVIDLGVRIMFALSANDFWRGTLEKKGWITTDVIVAGSEIEATHRFYDRHVGKHAQPFFSNPLPNA